MLKAHKKVAFLFLFLCPYEIELSWFAVFKAKIGNQYNQNEKKKN